MLTSGESAEYGQSIDGNVSSVLYAQGYQHASDKLLQMEVSRRTVFRTLYEFYGNSAVESDKLFRTLNLVDLAREDYS